MEKTVKSKRNSSATGSGRILIVSILLLLMAGVLSAAARMVPGFAQWYSITVYPVLQSITGSLAGFVPFSAAEVLCVVLPVCLIIDIIANVRKRRVLLHLLLAASVLLFLYETNCGVNYYREPFVDRDIYSSAQFTEEQLIGLCEYAASQLQKSSYEAGSLNNGASETSVYEYPSWSEIAESSVFAMEHLSESGQLSDQRGSAFCDFESLSGFYPRPKKLSYMSRLFSMMGVSGIYSPFTIEANVNGEMTGLEMPFTACHELSHLKGFMNEGEANFIGWLACINSGDPSFQRSGWIIAWIYAGNSLYRTDPDAYFRIKEKLPDDIIRELDENDEFWASHENKASEVQDRINDAYLKSNGQDDGIQTYGQLTTLMLLWYTS